MVTGNGVVAEEMRSSQVPDGFGRQDLLMGERRKTGKVKSVQENTHKMILAGI